MAPVFHMVLFKWKPSLSEERVKELCAETLALKDNCIHPQTNKPYIVSISGGKDNCPESIQMQGGLTHGFIIEFASIADRDYYAGKDPNYADPYHAKKGKMLMENVEDGRVVDYEVGMF